MQKHTPGPWRIGDAGRTIFGPQNGNPSPETIADIRKKANAKLIAASPCLLAALVELADAVDPEQGRDDIPLEEWAIGPIAAARAAIAKAEAGS